MVNIVVTKIHSQSGQNMYTHTYESHGHFYPLVGTTETSPEATWWLAASPMVLQKTAGHVTPVEGCDSALQLRLQFAVLQKVLVVSVSLVWGQH